MGQPWLLHIIWLISGAKKLDREVKQKLKTDKQNTTLLKLHIQTGQAKQAKQAKQGTGQTFSPPWESMDYFW